MSSTAVLQDENQILLPKVPARVGVDVLDALRARHSARDFLVKALPLDAVGMVLWAAFGINRPDSRGRTAPSAHGWQEIDIYAALPQGTYRYEPLSHRLDLVFARDVRAQTGLQDFVGQAPLNLIYVADLARMTGADEHDRAFYSATDTGFIAQNVYLACAAGGLATVVRGLVDRKALAAALGLSSTQRIILAQSIGFPRR